MAEALKMERKDDTAALRVRSALKVTPGARGLVTFFLKRMDAEHITSAAGALTFSTTLAIVPALALLLAGFTAFPAFNTLRTTVQNLIVNNLVPETGMKISDTLNNFVNAAGKLTTFGVIGLMASAILLLLTIEGQLNLVFHVTRPRPIVFRILIFWAVMTVGPFFLGLGLSLFGYFSAMPVLEKTPGGSALSLLLGNLFPTLLTWAVITFVFLLLPNRRIQWKDAMIGAGFAAGLLLILRYGFALYVLLATSYKAIYGALAAIPVFLMWLYLVWLFVMAGAVVTAGLPDWRSARGGFPAGPWGRIALALEVLGRLAKRQDEGGGLTRNAIIANAGAPEALVILVLEQMHAGKFVAHADNGEWVLSRDLDRVTLADLVHAFGLGLGLGRDATALPDNDVAKRLSTHLRSAADSEQTLLSISLARLATGQARE